MISGPQATQAITRWAYTLDLHTGSQMFLYKKGFPTLCIPNHDELAPRLLNLLIKKSGITPEEFFDTLG